MSITTICILVLCGMCTNLMSALFGIGGGVLMVPVLRTIFPQIPIQMVAATSLTIVMGTAIINLFYFCKQHIKVDIKRVLLWSMGMILGVQIGFELSFIVSEWIVVGVFVATLSLLAVKILVAEKEGEKDPNKPDQMRGIIYCTFGGSVAGMTGVGGGSIMAPLVSQLSSVKHFQVAVYTNWMMVLGGLGSLYGYLSKGIAIPESMLGSWLVGYVNFTVVLLVVGSSFFMSFFSMRIRGLLTEARSNKILGCMLLGIALYMLALQVVL